MIFIGLLLVGLSLIIAEFYLPGAIMAVLGAISLCASIALFAASFQSLGATLLFLMVVLALVVGVCKFMLWKIPRSQPDFSIYSNQDQSGYQASSYDSTLVGKCASALTDLKPGGIIFFEGKRLAAISQSGYLSKGSEVLIIGGEGESLIVKAYSPPFSRATHKEIR